MKYVILAFDDGKCNPAGEDRAEMFMRQFDQFHGLRTQIGARAAASVELTPDEERALWTGSGHQYVQSKK